MRTWLGLAVALAGWAVVAGTPAVALAPAPLPNFDVASLDGRSVASRELGSAGKWVLIYVRPKSVASEVLLGLVKTEEDAARAARIVVVVGGARADAQRVCDAFPALARAAWYADPDRAAFPALAINGAPTAVGLRDRRMQWTMNGVPADGRTVKSILLTWLAE